MAVLAGNDPRFDKAASIVSVDFWRGDFKWFLDFAGATDAAPDDIG